MVASTRSSLRWSCLGCLAVFALIGCEGKTTPSSTGDASSLTAKEPVKEPAKEPNVCAGRACGADCTPSDSDEPFNCSATGECVAAGGDLSCDVDAGPPAPTNPCENKACGVDCTPDNSDEPFNCNANHQCVVTGEPLGC